MDASPPVDVRAPSAWSFACPICQRSLALAGRDAHCMRCDRTYACSSGIWRFLPEERLHHYEQFLREYHIVRKDQGWGRPDAGYFLALPQVAPDDPQRDIWRRRVESCRLLLGKIIEPMAARREQPLRILDLGAGSCWLSHRLSVLGHRVAAVDLSVDPIDGLGAHAWYGPAARDSVPARAIQPPFTPIQAEFDRLPLRAAGADVVLFNASLHYSVDCAVTLREALRVLMPKGVVIIMDSPVYRHAGSGEQMVREREMELEHRYGFRSNSVRAEHFLTTERLDALARELALRWQTHAPAGRAGSLDLGARAKGRWRALRGLRELATMPVIVGYRA